MKRRIASLVLLLLALPATAQEMRNTVAVTADLTREDSRTTGSGNSQGRNILLDIEYARTMWSTLELTFAGSVRGVRQESGGVAATQAFRAWQIGGRLYFYAPRSKDWTPYVDGSAGEGWLVQSGSGSDTTQKFYGYELSLGAALHVSPRADLRLSANYDRYLATDKVGNDRDTFSRLGVRLGGAFRF